MMVENLLQPNGSFDHGRHIRRKLFFTKPRSKMRRSKGFCIKDNGQGLIMDLAEVMEGLPIWPICDRCLEYKNSNVANKSKDEN